MSNETIGPGNTIASRSHPEWGRGRVIQVVAAPTGEQAFVEFDSGRLEMANLRRTGRCSVANTFGQRNGLGFRLDLQFVGQDSTATGVCA